MTQSHEPADAGTLVAASLLRPDTDTRVASVYKMLAEMAGPGRSSVWSGDRLLDEIVRHLPKSPGGSSAWLAGARRRAGLALGRAAGAGIRPLLVTAPAYPDRLWQIHDPPIVLWIDGCVEVLALPSVAVVGARDATPGGLAIARRLGRELAEAGLVVVSGMARGVDAAAHQGALEAGGPTVAVLGCGADVTYPPEHRELARRISETGAVVSEFAPGSPPLARHFPLRNRIISGLSRAVVVIEASLRSGSLITARAGLEQGRDVLAVPGSVASERYRGSHALIKDGARLVETVEDVLEEIGWCRASAGRHAKAGKSLAASPLEAVMAAGEAYSLDELATATSRGAPDLLAELTTLEVAGRIVRLGGGSFAKVD